MRDFIVDRPLDRLADELSGDSSRYLTPPCFFAVTYRELEVTMKTNTFIAFGAGLVLAGLPMKASAIPFYYDTDNPPG